MSRRRRFSNAITSIYATNALVWSITTHPLEDAVAKEAPTANKGTSAQQAQRRLRPERVSARFTGQVINLTVAGDPGRYFAVLYNTNGERAAYRPYPGARGQIGPSGSSTLRIDMSRFPAEVGYFKVQTASNVSLQTDVQETEAETLEFRELEIFEDGAKSHFVEGPTRGLSALEKGAVQRYSPVVRTPEKVPAVQKPSLERLPAVQKPSLERLPTEQLRKLPGVEDSGGLKKPY